MAFILTFLGKGGTGRTTVAIAAAHRFAAQGRRVLLASQDCSPALGIALGAEVGPDPTTIAPNLEAVQLHSTVLLERAWEELKKLEAQYVRTPFFRNVYGQELGVLSGMDNALALNAIRQWDSRYDVIVYDSGSSPETLRMLGMPEIVSWYIRRFRQVFIDSDLGKTLAPFIPPIASAILSVNFAADNFAQPTAEMNSQLDQGKAKIADPQRTVAYLVTTDDPLAVSTAQYLWGSAQQVGLTIGGVIANQSRYAGDAFHPLAVTSVPRKTGDDWLTVMEALPDFSQAVQAPRPITINVSDRTVALFLPSFDKKQVKLTQYGPEITIEAGDQRRNIFLPPELSGLPVKGAKFQNSSLVISF
ncbi:ArsA family ATPase [Alkalinema pantanalense CENA528]|uniref:Get3/ArsA fold putative tail anchor-mediating ATPase NosAFP n=1 Tax=Alkalinema pantanalense TaxID=1620705 RepID=UPI003D6E1862